MCIRESELETERYGMQRYIYSKQPTRTHKLGPDII